MLSLLAGFVGELRAAGIPVSLERARRRRARHPVDRPLGPRPRARRPARDPGQGRRAPGGLRARLRGLLRAARGRVARPTRRPRAPARRRGRAERALAARRCRPPSSRPHLPVAARRRLGRSGARRRRGGDALRRDGAGPPGRRHLLPVPDAAQPRPRGPRGPPDDRRWPRAATSSRSRLAADDAHERVERLKREVERVIRERLVEDRGAEALAKSMRKPLPEDLDVMHANRDELAQLRARAAPPSPQAGGAPRAPAPAAPARAGRPAPHGAPESLDRRGAARPALQAAAPGQAGDLRHRRRLGVGRVLRALHAAPGARDLVAVLARSAASSSSTAWTR